MTDTIKIKQSEIQLANSGASANTVGGSTANGAVHMVVRLVNISNTAQLVTLIPGSDTGDLTANASFTMLANSSILLDKYGTDALFCNANSSQVNVYASVVAFTML